MNTFAEPNSADMAEEVENERAGLVNTLDQLRENLRPENMVDEMFSQAQANTSDAMDRVWQLARANPVPAALIGIGAAMLVNAGQRFRARSNARQNTWGGSNVELSDPMIFDAAAGDITSVSPTWTNGDQHRMTAMANTAGRPLTGLTRIIDEQPLVLAAIGIAVGAAVGSAIPSTTIESQWMGDASESVRQNANAMARDQIAQIRSTADQTLDQMKAAAAQHGVSSENLSGLVHDLGEHARKGAASLGQTTSQT